MNQSDQKVVAQGSLPGSLVTWSRGTKCNLFALLRFGFGSTSNFENMGPSNVCSQDCGRRGACCRCMQACVRARATPGRSHQRFDRLICKYMGEVGWNCCGWRLGTVMPNNLLLCRIRPCRLIHTYYYQNYHQISASFPNTFLGRAKCSRECNLNPPLQPHAGQLQALCRGAQSACARARWS